MKKLLCVVIAIVLIFETSYIFYITSECKRLYEIINTSNEFIDSLETNLEILEVYKDSVESHIQSIDTQIIYIKEKYEKDYIDVSNQSISDDIQFFTNYLLSQSN